MNEIQEGSPVRLIRDQDGHGKGLTGILRVSKPLYSSENWFIEFNEKQEFAHSGDGSVEVGFGWFVNIKNVELLIKPYDPTQGNEEDDI